MGWVHPWRGWVHRWSWSPVLPIRTGGSPSTSGTTLWRGPHPQFARTRTAGEPARFNPVNALASLLGTDSRRLRRLLRVLAGCGLAAVLAVVAPTWWTQVRPAPAWTVPGERVDAALAALGGLAVVEPRPLAEYDRDHLCPTWFDVDVNGCYTINVELSQRVTVVMVERSKAYAVVL